MKGKIWDLCAPIYNRAMQVEERSYASPYRRIIKLVRTRKVLELATGSGMLTRRVASVTKRMLAADYSESMIAEAKRGTYPRNLRFEVTDALSPPYADASFDVVIIMNTLHPLLELEFVLREIVHVLRPGSILTTPNFVRKREHFAGRYWGAVLGLIGVQFEYRWTAGKYLASFRDNG